MPCRCVKRSLNTCSGATRAPLSLARSGTQIVVVMATGAPLAVLAPWIAVVAVCHSIAVGQRCSLPSCWSVPSLPACMWACVHIMSDKHLSGNKYVRVIGVSSPGCLHASLTASVVLDQLILQVPAPQNRSNVKVCDGNAQHVFPPCCSLDTWFRATAFPDWT